MPSEKNILSIAIKLWGPAFPGDKAELHSMLAVMQGYEEAMGYCLQAAAKKNGLPEGLQYNSLISFDKMSMGSLELTTSVGCWASIAPLSASMLQMAFQLTPSVIVGGWELFKWSITLIIAIAKHFTKAGTPIEIKVVDSPNATVNVIEGNQISDNVLHTTQDLLNVSKKIAPLLEQMVSALVDRKVEQLSIAALQQNDEISIDHDDASYVRVPKINRREDDLVRVDGHIYRLNTKTKKGLLELVGEEFTSQVPFEIIGGEIEDYVDALKESHTMFVARPELTLDAFGETKVAKYFLMGLTTGQGVE